MAELKLTLNQIHDIKQAQIMKLEAIDKLRNEEKANI
jgi:hypothetical protein